MISVMLVDYQSLLRKGVRRMRYFYVSIRTSL